MTNDSKIKEWFIVHKLKTDAECFRDFELGYKTFETRQ